MAGYGVYDWPKTARSRRSRADNDCQQAVIQEQSIGFILSHQLDMERTAPFEELIKTAQVYLADVRPISTMKTAHSEECPCE